MYKMFNFFLYIICIFIKFYLNVQVNYLVGINFFLFGGIYDQKLLDGILFNFSLIFLVCFVGIYGFQCLYNCSENCLNILICNNINGFCDGVCVIGWGGDLCNIGKQFCFEK